MDKELLNYIQDNFPLHPRPFQVLSEKFELSEKEIIDYLKQLKDTLQNKGAIGKKLKFILQEMHREINTIGAKTNSLIISHLVIKVKQAIEKINEEIENIE